MYRIRPNPFSQGYSWLTERLYNELAWLYDPASWIASLGQAATVRNWALDYLTGPRVLELGFGTGKLLLEIARRNLDVYGLDLSPAMQRLAQSKLRRHGFSLPLVRGSTLHTPFADRSFNTIVATFPAGYIFDPATWQEAARLLRLPPTASKEFGGGRFVVVGLCASSTAKPGLPLIRFLFGLPMEDLLLYCKVRARSAGLDVRVVTRRHRMLDIPIIIAEKQA